MWPFKRKLKIEAWNNQAQAADCVKSDKPSPTQREAILAVQLSEMHTQLSRLSELRDQLFKQVDALTADNKELRLKLDVRFEIRELLTSIVAVQNGSTPDTVAQVLAGMKKALPAAPGPAIKA